MEQVQTQIDELRMKTDITATGYYNMDDPRSQIMNMIC